MGKFPNRQRGISLIISLIFLIVVTIFVLSATMTSMFGFRIATNVQTQNEAAAAAQAAIDQKLSELSFFTEVPYTGSLTPSVVVGATTYTVNVDLPRCISSGPDNDYSAFASPPRVTLWRVTATATNATNGAKATVTQGVKLRLDPGATCPN
jgi:Tfp pilus assembly protein PilX